LFTFELWGGGWSSRQKLTHKADFKESFLVLPKRTEHSTSHLPLEHSALILRLNFGSLAVFHGSPPHRAISFKIRMRRL